MVLDILGSTQLDFLGSGPHETPGIRIAFGRVVMRPLKAGMQLRVAFGDRSGVLQFSDAESVAALEVRRLHAQGMNPESEPNHMVAELFAAVGNLSWNEGSPPASIRLAPASPLRFNAQATVGPLPTKEVPQWTKPKALDLGRPTLGSHGSRSAIGTDSSLGIDQNGRTSAEGNPFSWPASGIPRGV